MHKFTVTYYLSDEENDRLEKITNAWESIVGDITENSLFEFMMICGSALDIGKKFSALERQLGIDN